MAALDFTRVFAESGAKETLTDIIYDGGWDSIVGVTPPTKDQFNSISNEQDKKLTYLNGTRVSRATGETAAVGDIVEPDNSAAILTINLPTADLFVGAIVYFEQVTDQLYSTYGLTLGRNGNNIEGIADDFVMDSRGADNTKIAATWVAGTIGWKISVVGVVGTTI